MKLEKISGMMLIVNISRSKKRLHVANVAPPKKNVPELAIVKAAKAKADEIKGYAYALWKAPEHLSEKQQLHVNLIA